MQNSLNLISVHFAAELAVNVVGGTSDVIRPLPPPRPVIACRLPPFQAGLFVALALRTLEEFLS